MVVGSNPTGPTNIHATRRSRQVRVPHLCWTPVASTTFQILDTVRRWDSGPLPSALLCLQVIELAQLFPLAPRLEWHFHCTLDLGTATAGVFPALSALLRFDAMFANQRIWKRKRDELSTRRAALLHQLDVKPQDPGLSSQLKVIDAEILECTRNMERISSVRPSPAEPKN